MRILHVIGSLDPKYGGPPKIAACLASAQAGLGHDVHILSQSSPGRDEQVQNMLKDIPDIEKVNFNQVMCRSGYRWLFEARLKRLMQDAVRHADVVHLHNVWELILISASNECRRMGKPYLILLNGMLDPWSLSQKRLKKKLAIALLYRRMYNGAAALHLGNIDEQNLLQPLALTSPCQIIPNGVFLEEIEPLPPAGAFRVKHPELGDAPFILFLSRLHYKKGLDYLAHAFRGVAEQRPEVHLVVAGPDGGAREPFVKMIRDAGLTDRVHVVGPIYGKTKYEALRDATCFCLPSRQEGFSIAITEALACGTPVVISEPCHFPEVDQAQAGFVLPLDPERFTQSLVTLLDDRGLRDTMSQNAAALVRQRYTWPKIAEQTLACYQQAGCRDRS